MKINKLSKVISSVMSITATVGIIVPLASCSQKKTEDIKIKILDESKKIQSIDSNSVATVVFELDKEGYNTSNLVIKAAGHNADDLVLAYDISGKTLTLTIRCPQPCADSCEYLFKLEFIHKDWNAWVSGFKFNVTRVGELKTVCKINDLLATKEKQPTMSALISLLKTNNIDLTSLSTEVDTDQWVWDYDYNVVFVLTKDGEVRTAPKGYVLNKNKTSLWKMVNMSTSNKIGAKIDTFSSSSLYSQYLRPGQTLSTKDIEVCSGLDTAEYEELNLKFKKSTSFTYTTPVVINTNKSNLEVESSLSDISHHGHLKTLTITEIPNNIYNEFGTVDARVVLNSGSMTVKDGAKINDIVVTSNDVKTVVLDSNATVGAVCTTIGVTKQISNIVDDSKVEETKKPSKEAPQDPEQVRYSGGFGTLNSPYVVSTKEQLLYCQEDVNNNGKNESHYILLNDINMEGVTTFSGIGTATAPFKGTFDGKGYTIKNLTLINASNSKGFFGVVFGQHNDAMPVRTTVWDVENNKVNYETTVKESSYSTIIKNVSLVNFTNKVNESANYSTGGIAGLAENAYISNCHVVSGEIFGYKGVGGILGNNNASTVINCSTGEGLTVKTSIYHAGGIAGNAERDWVSKPQKASTVFAYCTNRAHVIAEVKNQTSSTGEVSGIVALAQNSGKDYGLVIDHCENYGTIESKVLQESTTQFCPPPAGISGNGLGIYVCANTTNYGVVSTNGQVEFASGLLCRSAPIIFNCHNKGDVTANAELVSGILSFSTSTNFEINKFNNITNTGTITNTNASGLASPLVANKSGSKTIQIQNVSFASVEELNKQIASTQAISISLIDVNVANTEGTLDLKPSITSITSNKKVCSNVKLDANNAVVTIDMPDTNITVNGNYENTILHNYGKSSNVIIKQDAKLKSVTITGENSEITNSGTIVGGLNLSHRCVKGTNTSTGTIGNLSFDNSERDGLVGFDDKTFDNYGQIINPSTSTTHAISTISKSASITLNNYGTIKSETNGQYAFLFYNDSEDPKTLKTNKIYNYGEAKLYFLENRLYATHNSIYMYYKDGAKVYKDNSEVTWSSLASQGLIIDRF